MCAYPEARNFRHFQRFKTGNLTIFLANVFTPNSYPIGQTRNDGQMITCSRFSFLQPTMDSHNCTLSNESTPTLPINETTGDGSTSFSSDSSQISTRSIETVIQSEKPLSHLVEQAEKLIATLASHKTYNQLPYGDREIKAKIKLHLILESMLHYAHDCGGEGGKRYTAAAIYVCCREDGEQTLGFLQDLAATWLSHLLFVCKWLYSVAKSVV